MTVQINDRVLQLIVLMMLLMTCVPVSRAADLPTVILNNANSAPFTNEQHTGLVDIVAGEAFRRAGLKLKLIQLPAERALQNANKGIEDGEVSRVAGIEKHYTNLIPVKEKLVDHHFVAFTRHVDVSSIDWQSLKKYSIGYIRGYKIVERNIPAGTVTSTANSARQLFRMLDKERVDIIIYRRWEGLALAQEMGIQDVHILEPSLVETGIYIYLHKKHADKVPLITQALREIKKEGLFKQACLAAFADFNPLPKQCYQH